MIAVPEEVLALCRVWRAHGATLYLVGGWVRNACMGLAGKDIDVASAAHPAEAAAWVGGAKVVNETLGTVLLPAGGRVLEHTTFRIESYQKGHMPDSVRVGVTMEEDAQRRDFSVNALYYDPLEERLCDPTGRGLLDIAHRRLRTARFHPEETMRDDPLRLLRMVRFAAEYGLKIDPPLFACARRMAPRLKEISAERIFSELMRILMADGAQGKEKAHRRGLLLLEASGLLEQAIPELAAGRGMVQGTYHRYTVLHHAVMTAAAAPHDPVVRLAALLHDIAKPALKKETGRFTGHDTRGAKMAAARLRQLRCPRALLEPAAELIGFHMYDLDGRARTVRVRQLAQRLGREQTLRLAALREADVWGSGIETGEVATAKKLREAVNWLMAEGAPFSVRDLAISGEALLALGIPKGPAIGAVERRLLAFCAAGPGRNRKERLLAQAKREWRDLQSLKKYSMIRDKYE